MSSEYAIHVDSVDKVFYTRHFFKRNPDTNQLKWYEKRHIHAVDHVQFGVRPGEIFGLLGPNGAGKTTTVKMLSGLVRPDGGAVYIDGLNVETRRKQILRKIGVVLEGTRTVIWPLTPLENLAYFGNLRDVRGSVLKKRSHELLDFIGLREKKDVQVRRLSRGQKQKLAICIALVTDPHVILLDEPTTGLDVQSGRSIKEKIIEMTRMHGKSVLVTTHDMHVAQELCDRIGIIDRGKLIACKTTEEMLTLSGDLVYEVRVDRPLSPTLLADIEGVISARELPDGEGFGCAVRLAADDESRSRALYGVMDRLKANHYRLLSIDRHKQMLEDVFLKLTGGA